MHEWVGGKVPLSNYVIEGAPLRPDIILWLELPQGVVVGSDLVVPREVSGKAPPTVAQTLLRAIKSPEIGEPRRPKRLRVANRSLAAQVERAVRGIEVVVAPTPEIQALADQMAASLAEEPSYLEGGEISTSAVGKLFHAADRLWRAAPWKGVSDFQAIRLDIPQLGIRGGCLSVIGGMGESFGLVLFPSLAGFEAFVSASARKRKPLDFGTTLLALDFERADDLPACLRHEVAAYKWPVASSEAYPWITHRDRDGVPRPTTEQDVWIMASIAETFVPFYAKHSELFLNESPITVSDTFRSRDDISVRFTAPYDEGFSDEFHEPQGSDARIPRSAQPKPSRNAPCSCGSGLKYKKCCLQKEEAAVPRTPSHLHEQDQRLVVEMMGFANERFGAAWRRSERDFLNAEEAGQLYCPWSVYMFLVEGRPVVDWFLEAAQSDLRPDERAWLVLQKQSWLGIWEALDVEPGRGMTVRDLLSGQTRTVVEVKGSTSLKRRDTLLARIADCGDISVFVGTHHRPLTPQFADEVARAVRRKLRITSDVPIERLREEPIGRFLIKRWEQAVVEMDAQAAVLPELHNTDGDPLLMTVDHFTFGRALRKEIAQRLSELEDVELEDVELEDGNQNEQAFTFLRPGNAIHKSWENTVVGRAVLDDKGLRIESNSVRRADTLRKRLEKHLGARVRHRVREHMDPLSPGNRESAAASSPKNDIPPTEMNRLLREYKEQHYGDWLDHPLPALSGKTPRQAARTKAGRAKLDLLLKEIENLEADLPEDARFDFSRFRNELGLNP